VGSARSLAASGELPAAVEEQVLSFRIAGTEFACPVRNLREVVELVEISRVEGQSGRIEGVINYRGAVIAVVDGRRALGFSAPRGGVDAHIVVAEVGERVVGLAVDQVLDVLTLPPDALEPPGPMVPLRALLSGIAKLGDRLLFVLDLEQLLGEALPELSAPTIPTEQPSAELRSVLRRRTAELARPVAAAAVRVAQAAAMVCFALGEGAYAIRAEYAKEIVQVPRIAPVPSAPAYVMGAVNIRGAILAVVSVAALLGFRVRPSGSDDARIIVVEVAGAVVGLHVDRVVGIYEVEARDIAPPFAQLETGSASCVEGEFDHAGKVLCLVDAAAVVRMLEQQSADEQTSAGGGSAAAVALSR
jgi:purine-binding chemotaxis protein CheW